MSGRALFLASGLLVAPSAYSQIPEVGGILHWVEVAAGTNEPVPAPNGVLEPGEAARIELSLSFQPGVGTAVPYQLPGGGTGLAPIAGFSAGLFALEASSALGGAWSHPESSPGFIAEFGVPSLPNGSLAIAGVYQPYPPIGQFPLPTNPLPRAWSAVWTPPIYSQRVATFTLNWGGHSPELFVHTGYDPSGNPRFWYAEANAPTLQVMVPVVPTPASVFGLVGFGLASRRRWR